MRLLLLGLLAISAPLNSSVPAAWVIRVVGLLLLGVGIARMLYPPKQKDLIDAQYDHE